MVLTFPGIPGIFNTGNTGIPGMEKIPGIPVIYREYRVPFASLAARPRQKRIGAERGVKAGKNYFTPKTPDARD